MNTTLCYLMRDGEVLMLHRTKKKDDLNAGKWIGVGGRFEPGESPDECLVREVKEETGYLLRSWRFRGIVTFDADDAPETEYMHLFTSSDFAGEEIVCDEGELRWVPAGEIEGLPLWEGDRVFLRLLREDAPFFSLKLVYRAGKLREVILNGRKTDG